MTTTNKGLNQPANNASGWDTSLNNNFGFIDSALGTVAVINPTSQSGTIALTLTQYQSMGLLIGTSIGGAAAQLTASIIYTVPSGVGGTWVVYNNTTGSYTITIANAATPSGGIVIPQGQTRSIYSDGVTTHYADTQTTTAGFPTQVIYNSAGTLTGNAGFTFDGTTVVTPNISSTGPAYFQSTALVGGVLTADGLKIATGGGGSLTFADSTVQTTAATSSKVPTTVVHNSSTTWTIPANVTRVRVTVVGGGAGGNSGGSGGGGGGAGGTAIRTVTGLTPGGTVAITVGAGGGIAAAGNTSSFGSYCSATGGSAGGPFAGGPGGQGSNGDLNIAGGGGGAGGVAGGTNVYGAGGSSYLGGGGAGFIGTSLGYQNGGIYGGGGGAVGVGAQGVVIIEY